jgi:hypothetical protein
MSLAWFFQAESCLDQLPESFFLECSHAHLRFVICGHKKDGMDTADSEHAYKLLFCFSIYFIYIKVTVVFFREFFKNRHHHFMETAPVCVKNNDTGFLLLYSILWILQGHIRFL